VLGVDDACRSWYSKDPANRGVGLSTGYTTQIMHQPGVVAFANGRRVPFTVEGGLAVFMLAAPLGQAADWAVVAR
jgi:hypothetical protein